jgi:cysteine desulfurase/selenocysteine lyase
VLEDEFPICKRTVEGKPVAYLDNASTTQKPRAVLDAVDRYYRTSNANVHRGVHTLSVEATEAYEGARARVARYLGAKDAAEIVFTRGTTEAINLVAYGSKVGPGDEVLVTELEHHSNLVPWQQLCLRTGATLRVLPIDDAGDWRLDAIPSLLGPNTKIVAMNHVSNSLGSVNDIATLIAAAREVGAVTVVDGAQRLAHGPVDVSALGCDFYALSGHKMYGPMGIGALYGRDLEALPPWQFGGDMVLTVSFDETTFNDVPHRFEAGTPNVAGAVGLAAAMDFLEAADLVAVANHERALLDYAVEQLSSRVRLIGTPKERSGVVSFAVEGVHPHDVGTILDTHGVAVRAGHHCTQPVMEHFGVPATVRLSVAMYNAAEEIDRLVAGLDDVRGIFG